MRLVYEAGFIRPRPGRRTPVFKIFLISLCGCIALSGCGPMPDSGPAATGSGSGRRGAGRSGGENENSRPQKSLIRIVFFGDSITEAGLRPDGYVTLVREKLRERYRGMAIEVLASGVTGDNVSDLQRRLERDVLKTDPTHVVVYVGVNDVGERRFTPQVSVGDAELYRRGLLDIIHRIQRSGATAGLCTPAVFGDDPDKPTNENRLLEEYAEISRRVAGETGARLCDLRATFSEYLRTRNSGGRDEGVVSVDGVHLNEEGNRLVAAQMLKVLELPPGFPSE